MSEADPNLELYHANFRRPTNKLRQIYKISSDEKLKVVLRHIFSDRKVSPEEIQVSIEHPTQEEIQQYKEKQERKLERYTELAGKHEVQAIQARESEHKILDMIPLGQPILIGHHSERRHRRDLERADRLFHKSIEEAKTAEYYKTKVENLENPKAISSDDPEAIIKLNAEIAELETQRDQVKNNYVINENAKMWEEGSEHWRRVELESLSRRIRDKKKRIDELRALKAMPDYDKTINGVRIYTDKTDNRLRMDFPGKPSPEIINRLKSSGFRWSPYNQVWQRMISNQAEYLAETIAKEIKT